jgi:hypothetical protein
MLDNLEETLINTLNLYKKLINVMDSHNNIIIKKYKKEIENIKLDSKIIFIQEWLSNHVKSLNLESLYKSISNCCKKLDSCFIKIEEEIINNDKKWYIPNMFLKNIDLQDHINNIKIVCLELNEKIIMII